MLDGLREEWNEQPFRWISERRVIGPWFWVMVVSLVLLLFVSLGVFAHMARADTVQLSNCSQTVGASAAAVAFPTAGSTGPANPRDYLQICNAHASNTLGVNAVGGSASIGAAGTLTLNPGGCAWWNTTAIPGAVSVIGSAGGTTTACWYK
jgi:hypothetical protein